MIGNDEQPKFAVLPRGEHCFHVCKASMKGKPQEPEKGKLMLLVYTVEIPYKVGNIREVEDALKLL